MNYYKQAILITLAALSTLACSKSDSTTDPDLTSSISGAYNLTQLTKKDGGATVTATGSATITAVDKTNIKVRQALVITKSALSTQVVDLTYSYAVSQTGSVYTILYDATSAGTVTGSKLTTTNLVLSGEPTLTTLSAEYIKQ